MTIAQLFVELGVIGTTKTTQALKSVRDDLTDVSMQGLAAKAAVLGVVYALEQMVTSGLKAGANLTMFSRFTGMDPIWLQKWQELMRGVGVSAEDTESSIEGLQKVMGEMSAGQGAPKGLQAIYLAMQQMGRPIDMARFQKDMKYAMSVLRDYATHSADSDVMKNMWLGSIFGSKSFIAGIKSVKDSLDSIRPSRILDAKELATLNKGSVAWSDFLRDFDMLKEHLSARYAISFISNLDEAVQEIQSLADAFEKLNPFLKTFLLVIGGAAGAAFTPLTAAITALTLVLSDMHKGKEGIIGQALGMRDKADKWIFDKVKSVFGVDLQGPNSIFNKSPLPPTKEMLEKLGPRDLGVPTKKKEGPEAFNNEINVHNYGVKDAHEVADHVGRSVNYAIRQSTAAFVLT